MTTITNTDPNVTYKSLLTCGVTGTGSSIAAAGITSSVQTVQDALGSSSALGISTTQVNCGNLTFNGNTINTTSGSIIVTPNITFNGTVTGLTLANPSTFGSYVVTFGGTTTFGGTVSTAGNFTTTGSTYNYSVTLTGNTSVTSPTTGTLATLAGSETFTNKILTTPTLTTPVINGTITGTTVIPVANGGSGQSSYTNGQLLIGNTSGNTLTKSTLTAGTGIQITNSTGSITIASTVTGVLVQRTHAAVAATSGTASIPIDNTIPQISEGFLVATLAITPLSISNRLKIRFVAYGEASGASSTAVVALFQDSTANALTANMVISGAGGNYPITADLSYDMAAGTTSSTTFTIRLGINAGTARINSSAVATLGGIFPNGGLFEILEYTQ